MNLLFLSFAAIWLTKRKKRAEKDRRQSGSVRGQNGSPPNIEMRTAKRLPHSRRVVSKEPASAASYNRLYPSRIQALGGAKHI